MIDKTFLREKDQQVVRVTFTMPTSTKADTISLVGDFNDWNRSTHRFRRNGEGKWVLTVDLEPGRAYQFRYLRDDQEWMYDSQADAYVYNPHSNHNFVIVTDPGFKRYRGEGRE